MNEDCAICKESLVDESAIIKLSCNHWFHYNCIKQHMDIRCPLCRQETNVLREESNTAYEHVNIILDSQRFSMHTLLEHVPPISNEQPIQQSLALSFQSLFDNDLIDYRDNEDQVLHTSNSVSLIIPDYTLPMLIQQCQHYLRIFETTHLCRSCGERKDYNYFVECAKCFTFVHRGPCYIQHNCLSDNGYSYMGGVIGNVQSFQTLANVIAAANIYPFSDIMSNIIQDSDMS